MNFTKLLHTEGTPDWMRRVFADLALYPYLADILVLLSTLVTVVVVSLAIHFLVRRLLVGFYRRHCVLSPELRRCLRNMSFALASCLPIYTIIYCIWVDGMHEWIVLLVRLLTECLLVVVAALSITYGVRSVGLWYKLRCNATQRPIDGLLGVVVGFVWAGAAILLVSAVLGKNPLYLLSGLGAAAAVLLLFFQQAIHSVVASVQVNADRLVEIGDWIVLEDDGVDGVVEEISLHTAKVRNWDRTVACVPVCDLVSKPFVNFTAMQKAGGRRIKRSILIDQRSIRFLTKEEVEALRGFDILKDYLDGKVKEIGQYNAGRSGFNTRYLTNLGTFRMYAERYIAQNPNVRADMPLMARTLAPTSAGVPLEIYCFSKEVNWIPYEKVQSDIMEHLLAILPNFRLRVFQDCSDIYQEVGSQVDVVGGAFRFDKLENPVYPE